MSTLKTKDIDKALTKKGFLKKEKKHHRYYLFDENGKKTKISTMISHGHAEIGDSLIERMHKQMNITKEEFLQYVSCELSIDQYYDILKSKKLI